MGSRYGVKIRARENAILVKKRAKHECPKCGKKKVKRIGTALWKCNSCNAEYAGGSYVPRTTVGETVHKAIEAIKQARA